MKQNLRVFFSFVIWHEPMMVMPRCGDVDSSQGHNVAPKLLALYYFGCHASFLYALALNSNTRRHENIYRASAEHVEGCK